MQVYKDYDGLLLRCVFWKISELVILSASFGSSSVVFIKYYLIHKIRSIRISI